ncbi:MAG: hypothetical protein ACLVIY_03755 [Anaerobutyricum soehngenii]
MATNLAIASAAIFVPFAVISAVLFGKELIFSAQQSQKRVKQYSQIWMGKAVCYRLMILRSKVQLEQKRR